MLKSGPRQSIGQAGSALKNGMLAALLLIWLIFYFFGLVVMVLAWGNLTASRAAWVGLRPLFAGIAGSTLALMLAVAIIALSTGRAGPEALQLYIGASNIALVGFMVLLVPMTAALLNFSHLGWRRVAVMTVGVTLAGTLAIAAWHYQSPAQGSPDLWHFALMIAAPLGGFLAGVQAMVDRARR